MESIKRNVLLNPGPSTTTDTVKYAQVVPDICPREKEFAGLMKGLREDLVRIVHGDPGKYTSVLFCGSGTIPIEAAMRARNIAPGINRAFQAEEWTTILTRDEFSRIRRQAKEEERVIRGDEVDIQGFDIDGRAVRASRENARSAGVEDLIHFQRRAVKDFRHSGKYGFIVTNPPYGERLEELFFGVLIVVIINNVDDSVPDDVGDVHSDSFSDECMVTFFVDDGSLFVHHVVIFEEAFSDAEVVFFYFLLCPFDALVNHGCFDSFPFLESESVHDGSDSFGCEESHEFVFQ